jgi:hypothetical protein
MRPMPHGPRNFSNNGRSQPAGRCHAAGPAWPEPHDIKLDDKGGNFDISYRRIWTASSCRLPACRQEQDNIDLDFSYNNLNKQALLAWQADTMALANRADLRNNPAAMQQASMALVYKHMGAFLAQSPSFNLQRLSLHMPKGNIQGSFSIGFDGSGVKAADITLPWLAAQAQQRSTLKASLAVDRSLLDALAPSAGQGTSRDDADTMANPGADQERWQGHQQQPADRSQRGKSQWPAIEPAGLMSGMNSSPRQVHQRRKQRPPCRPRLSSRPAQHRTGQQGKQARLPACLLPEQHRPLSPPLLPRRHRHRHRRPKQAKATCACPAPR